MMRYDACPTSSDILLASLQAQFLNFVGGAVTICNVKNLARFAPLPFFWGSDWGGT